MSEDNKINKVGPALILLKRLDVAQICARDAVVLYYIIRNPGASRQELANALGLNAESNVRLPVRRLTNRKLIEDRRKSEKRLTASLLHATPAGVETWESLVR